MRWTNWAATASAVPQEWARPRDAGEAAALLHAAAEQGRRVKALGAGHSFSAIAQPTDIAVDTSALAGLRRYDPATGLLTVGAGTPLHVLNTALAGIGRALPNLGDIDRQTIAGAVATGTHGTGADLHGIASAVVGVQLATAGGEVLDLAPGDPLFDAARINLGALGIVTHLVLETVPAFRLRAVEGSEPLDALLESPEAFATSADHAEFFWFPHTDVASTKRNHRAGAESGRPLPAWQALLEDEVLSNGAFAAINRVGRNVPTLVPALNRLSAGALNRLSAGALGRRTYADASYKVFCSPRRVRFVEAEFALPMDSLGDVLGSLRAWFSRTRAPIQFPLEVRFLAADDVWLSGAQGRASAIVSVHQYRASPLAGYFDHVERVVAEHGGRPHWGKMHHLGLAELERVHSHLTAFRAVRDRLDPQRVLTNPYLARVLGP